MKNTFGNSVCVTLFGESHGDMIGAVLDGIPAGIRIDEALIEKRLRQRRGLSEISTARREADSFKAVSGIFNGFSTGTPICVLIENGDTDSGDYDKLKNTPRPSHSDFAYHEKYHGFNDYRGGGHSSGRLTAPIVAVGAICETALKEMGIEILVHIKKCGDIEDVDFSDIKSDSEKLENADFPVLSEEVGDKMREKISETKKSGDSLGGVIEVMITGVPAGIGEPWFDTVEGELSHAMFSIPAVKGIEFGAGFALSELKGSEANDRMCYRDGKVRTLSNNSGGILGGVTNGENIVFRLAVKPTPSISIKQETVDLSLERDTKITVGGRHDPFIAHKAAIPAKSLAAITICDMIAQRYGTEAWEFSR